MVAIGGWMLIAVLGQIAANGQSFPLFWIGLQQLWLILTGFFALPFRELFSWTPSEIGRGMIAGLGIFFLNTLLGSASLSLWSQLLSHEAALTMLEAEQAGFRMLQELATVRGRLPILLLVVVGAPLSEELFFRGVLLRALSEKVLPPVAVAVTALFFAAVHFYVIQFLPILVSGLVLGGLYMASGCLTRPLIAHAVVNALVFHIHFSIH